MFATLAGRLLTGPLAFLVAGVVDVAAFALESLRERVRSWGRPRAW